MQPKLYPCGKCNRNFGSLAALNQHAQDTPSHSTLNQRSQQAPAHAIPAPSFACGQCNRTFGTQEALNQHLAESKIHKIHKQSIVCLECNIKFSSQDAKNNHLRDSPAHAPSIVCPECNTKFGSQEAKNQHLKTCPAHAKQGSSNGVKLPSASNAQNGQQTTEPNENSSESATRRTEESSVSPYSPPSNPKAAELSAFLQSIERGISDTDLNEMRTKLFQSKSRSLESNEQMNQVLLSSSALENCAPSERPQHGLLGELSCSQDLSIDEESTSHLYLNAELPCSIFICGLQGSGKSHTLTCFLENYLIPDPIHGKLDNPCSALVFHYNVDSLHSTFRPSESAFMGHANRDFAGLPAVRRVNVLVAPSNFNRLRDAYAQIPGVSVHSFKFKASNLNVSSILDLMAVNQGGEQPLYIQEVKRLLQEMATDPTEEFSYSRFKSRLAKEKFSYAQRAPLEQRLHLLEQFLDPNGGGSELDLEPSALTIIDLSCPFVDHNLACIVFKISMSIFLASGGSMGKVVAMDEAHKFMTKGPGAESLTESTLHAIRMQRHLGLRFIVSTQEPTISPRIIDLSSLKIIHRFTSPDWYRSLRKHIAITDDELQLASIFREIASLGVGRALIFSPATQTAPRENGWAESENNDGTYRVQVRRKTTWDAGRSVVNA